MLRPSLLPAFGLLACIVSTQPARAQEPADQRPWVIVREPSAAQEPVVAPASPVRIIITPSRPSHSQAYCVRLCDGFYFPVTGLSSASPEQEANLCNALCPGAKTAVYASSAHATFETAVTRGGAKIYRLLPSAFAYRKNLSAQCSCGAPIAGRAMAALLRDPTLRPGDIVVTDHGVRIFQGSAGFPHREEDFVAYRSQGVPPAMQNYLAMIDRPYASKRAVAEQQKAAEKKAASQKIAEAAKKKTEKHAAGKKLAQKKGAGKITPKKDAARARVARTSQLRW